MQKIVLNSIASRTQRQTKVRPISVGRRRLYPDGRIPFRRSQTRNSRLREAVSISPGKLIVVNTAVPTAYTLTLCEKCAQPLVVDIVCVAGSLKVSPSRVVLTAADFHVNKACDFCV